MALALIPAFGMSIAPPSPWAVFPSNVEFTALTVADGLETAPPAPPDLFREKREFSE